jgi:hypothetical protein
MAVPPFKQAARCRALHYGPRARQLPAEAAAQKVAERHDTAYQAVEKLFSTAW